MPEMNLLARPLQSEAPPEAASRDPADIVADYLAHVRKQLMQNLERTYTSGYTTMKMDLVVTFPAVWSDEAKNRTIEAVTKAGFDKTNFPGLGRTTVVTEPEAASIYVFKSMRQGNLGSNIVPGNCFVLCDAGGGTCDLISYRVTSVSPTFQIEEAAIGTGARCGGSFVDRSFLTWLEKKLGTESYQKIADASTGTSPDQRVLEPKLARLIQDFMLFKTSFSGEDVTHYLRLPKPLNIMDDDEERGIVDGELLITK